MNENKTDFENHQKTVKVEIGKLLAIVITVVVIAFVTSAYLSSDYYKGMLGGDEQVGALTQEEEDLLAKDCSFFTAEELQSALENKYLTEAETVLINQCIEKEESETSKEGALTQEEEDLLAKDCSFFTAEELQSALENKYLTEAETVLINQCQEEQIFDNTQTDSLEDAATQTQKESFEEGGLENAAQTTITEQEEYSQEELTLSNY